jgi:hypothetical protein
MMSIAADKGVDVFYIWYGNNQVDTLNVDATSEDIEESDCKHKRYHWNSITYRGGQLVKDTSYTPSRAFTFLLKRD